MNPPAGFRLAPAADADLIAILRFTGRRFGVAQRHRYAALLRAAIDRVALHPDRPGSQPVPAVAGAVRSYPVRLAGSRVDASPHILFYRSAPGGILILRILHAAMDPSQHLAP